MVNSADFAKRLQKILDYYGLSATAFSERVSVNRSTISHLLSARNKPSLEFVMKVLDKFPEVELYWLMNGTGSFPAVSVQSDNKTTSSENETQVHQLPKFSSDSPSEDDDPGRSNVISKKIPSSSGSDIDRIVIFYKDGSFKAYEN